MVSRGPTRRRARRDARQPPGFAAGGRGPLRSTGHLGPRRPRSRRTRDGQIAFAVGPVDPHAVAGQPAELRAWGARRCCPPRPRRGRHGPRWRRGSRGRRRHCRGGAPSGRRPEGRPGGTMRASASAPRSPVNRMRTPRTVTRATIDRSLGAAVRWPGPGREPGPRRRPRRRSAGRPARAPPAGSGRGDEPVEGGDPVVRRRQRRRSPRCRLRPSSAPARPPAWSASRWESSTSGRASMPNRSRHRSTPPTSGPASTSTPAPGPVGSTSASPCPTSQATATVCAGGQPRTVWRSGQPSTTRPTTAARASGRSRGNRQSAQPPASSRPVSSTAPRSGRPAGRRVRDRRGPLGHQHQPAHRPAGEPDERVGQPAARPAPTTAASSPARWPVRRRGRPAGSRAARPG